MNGINNQAMLGAGQPFRAELTQRQESSGGGGVAKTFVKIILTLVTIGCAIVALPFIFCIIAMFTASIGGTIVGIVLGGIAVIVFLFFVGKAVIKIFKKK